MQGYCFDGESDTRRAITDGILPDVEAAKLRLPLRPDPNWCIPVVEGPAELEP